MKLCQIWDKSKKISAFFIIFQRLFEEKVFSFNEIEVIIQEGFGFVIGLQIFKDFGGFCESVFFKQNGEFIEFEDELLRFGGFSFFL